MNISDCQAVPLRLWIFEELISVPFALDSHKEILDPQSHMNPHLTAVKHPLRSDSSRESQLERIRCRSSSARLLDIQTALHRCSDSPLLFWMRVQVSAWHLVDSFIIVVVAAASIIQFYEYYRENSSMQGDVQGWKQSALHRRWSALAGCAMAWWI